MKEFIEKLIERLEKLKNHYHKCCLVDYNEGAEVALTESIIIVNQLAEEYKLKTNANMQEVIDNLEVYTVGRLNTSKVDISVLQLQRYINRLKQIAEEYNNGFCEWFKYDYRTIAPKNHDAENPYWRIPENLDKLKYCPYCGKKIKVVE